MEHRRTNKRSEQKGNGSVNTGKEKAEMQGLSECEPTWILTCVVKVVPLNYFIHLCCFLANLHWQNCRAMNERALVFLVFLWACAWNKNSYEIWITNRKKGSKLTHTTHVVFLSKRHLGGCRSGHRKTESIKKSDNDVQFKAVNGQNWDCLHF